MKQFTAQGTEKRTGRQIRIGLRAPNRGWAVWIAMTQFSHFTIREGRVDQVEERHGQTLD